MPGVINFNDGASASIVFAYANFSRSRPKKGGDYYYTVSGEGQMRYNMNAHGIQAVIDSFPGKGGSLTLTRHAETQWSVDNVQQGDQQYPLQMTEWSQNTNSFQPTAWAPGQSLDLAGPAQSDAPPQGGAAPRANPTQSTITLDQMGELWARCWAMAWAGAAGMDKLQGDQAGAMERAAVTIYMDARKMGLTHDTPSTSGDDLPF